MEEKLRQQIVDAFCGRFGELQSAFLNPANYRSEPSYSHTVSGLVNKFLKSAVSDKDHAYVIHQRNHYHNVPLWTVVKVVTFGTLSKMYSVLQYPQRIQIARSFLYPSDRQLEKAVDCMTYFRNICAHNERLYSFKLNQRSFPDTTLHSKLSIPQKGNEYIFGKKDYFALGIALRYTLPHNEFLSYKRSLKRLISGYSKKANYSLLPDLLNAMGFPLNWEKITTYNP